MFKSAAKSHIGHVRSCNEDSFIENTELGLWVVADGVGGNAHGDFASQVVTQTIERKIRLGSTLKQAIEDAHSTVIKLGRDKPDINGMASTVVGVHFKGAQYEICWVGDSRAYLINKETGIRQLTIDHNHAQQLVEAGEISSEEARVHPSQRVLMHAVGVDDDSWKVDQIEGELVAGDKILLCSDGLSGEVDDNEIFSVIEQESPLNTMVDELIDRALNHGGSDNITLTLTAFDRHGIQASKTDGELQTLDDTAELQVSTEGASKSALKYTILGIVAAILVITAAVWMA